MRENRDSQDAIMDTKDIGLEEKSTREKALEQALEGLFNTDNMPMKSDLQPKQITAIARGKVFADRFQSKSMNSLINHVLELSVSKNRKGRQEFVDLMQSTKDEDETQGLDKNMFQRLFNS